MTSKQLSVADWAILALERRVPGPRIAAVGRSVGLAGVVLPLFLIGLLKFTQFDVEALLGLSLAVFGDSLARLRLASARA